MGQALNPFVGMVHLLPLPGSPRGGLSFEQVYTQALDDARHLLDGGVDGIIVENFGDAPFCADSVSPYTVAAMTRITTAIRALDTRILLGVNVLRNDARSALGVATAADADFIRVNVHTGATMTDQGVITGRARKTLLERNRLGSTVKIAADIDVKHGAPLTPRPLVEIAAETWARGGAEVLIVTGSATGAEAAVDDLQTVKTRLPEAILWLGSGVTMANIKQFRPHCDGVIVGTALHQEGDLARPICPHRTSELVTRWR